MLLIVFSFDWIYFVVGSNLLLVQPHVWPHYNVLYMIWVDYRLLCFSRKLIVFWPIHCYIPFSIIWKETQLYWHSFFLFSFRTTFYTFSFKSSFFFVFFFMFTIGMKSKINQTIFLYFYFILCETHCLYLNINEIFITSSCIVTLHKWIASVDVFFFFVVSYFFLTKFFMFFFCLKFCCHRYNITKCLRCRWVLK